MCVCIYEKKISLNRSLLIFLRLQKYFRAIGDFVRNNKCPSSYPSQAQSWHKGMIRALVHFPLMLMLEVQTDTESIIVNSQAFIKNQ